jgi:predicted Zn-dependent protease
LKNFYLIHYKMKRSFLIILTVFFTAISCSKVPVTGRRQFAPIPAGQLHSLSFDSYKQVMSEAKLSTNQQQVNMVRNTGNKIKGAVEKYMADNGMADQLKGFEWEFNLIEEDIVNAWAMPGGKVAFYTGILPVCKDETGIAVVMGHEVAHAIAKHGNERMTQGLMQQLGGMTLAVALRDQPQTVQSLALTAFGAGSTVFGTMPFGRMQESEADNMGLTFMAMAGYDPREAPRFWERMHKAGEGQQQPPEFLSTHPSHDRRIRDLNSWLPEAMKYYKE